MQGKSMSGTEALEFQKLLFLKQTVEPGHFKRIVVYFQRTSDIIYIRVNNVLLLAKQSPTKRNIENENVICGNK